MTRPKLGIGHLASGGTGAARAHVTTDVAAASRRGGSQMLCCDLVVDPRDDVRRRATASLAYYCGVALATAVLFALVVPFRPWPFRVPFAYREDGLVLTALVKAIAEDGPLHFTRVGAPFGAVFVDWGFGGWLIFLVTTPLVGLLGSPGAALNAY